MVIKLIFVHACWSGAQLVVFGRFERNYFCRKQLVVHYVAGTKFHVKA